MGSKIIRRKRSGTQDPVEVHSYITPGDWIFVGKLTESIPRTVDGTYSDDPYEFSYQVRDVNYDKIVLWLPYKGEQAGTEKTVGVNGFSRKTKTICNLLIFFIRLSCHYYNLKNLSIF